MHPSELKNQALVAAAVAERDGFTATAEALKLLATACAAEADNLLRLSPGQGSRTEESSTLDGSHLLEITH